MTPHPLDVVSLVFGLLFVGLALVVPALVGAGGLQVGWVLAGLAITGGLLLAGPLRHRDH